MTYDHQGRTGRRLTATVTDLDVAVQKAFLVGVQLPDHDTIESERSLDELALLTDTAGSEPVGMELVRRDAPDAAWFIGSGKAEELAMITQALDVDVVVFDNPLSPAQQRNLQKRFECDVVDREALILDIFAQHASSREGAIQVELALLRYRLPRLRGLGLQLSRQGAGSGIANRGPGETRLETDRRRIEIRISKLERQLAALSKTRTTQRKARRRAEIPQVAVVGYTNAGKSTLLNRLTAADVLTEDRLFATLDSTVRKAELPDGRRILLSDTVGFIRRLPHNLVEAFRSTLEDTLEATLLLHLVDASDPDPDGQIKAVHVVLEEIGARDLPEVIVFNKIDAADNASLGRLRNLHPEAAFISATTGEGVAELLAMIAERLAEGSVVLRLQIPYTRSDLIASAHRVGEVLAEKHEDTGTILEVRLDSADIGTFTEFALPA
ncbi:MAG TPA: GTPase HflX [Acidimicrobiia bacterium]|nr:GTPase HflX [Acidimicrobiia bacterium]